MCVSRDADEPGRENANVTVFRVPGCFSFFFFYLCRHICDMFVGIYRFMYVRAHNLSAPVFFFFFQDARDV